ncbi:MAG: ABC transporter ATP-binding protein [Proteobacteria bacterium]|nr:ABC transporter ATP-binding protein [Pseudomonadota bacterium]
MLATNTTTPTITESAETILSVKELAVAFQSDEGDWLTAVDNVSFDLKKGSVLGLVGESGCGKSVTSYAIMRLLPQPQSKILRGEIWLKTNTSSSEPLVEDQGINLVSYPQKLLHKIRGRRIAMIFQDSMSALNPVHKIGKQIAEVYRLHFPEMSPSEVRKSMLELLHQVQMPDPEQKMDAFPHQLSGGMRQRVMIAMALACQPDILIADEPTTALDVTVQAQILNLIYELKEQTSMSILLITHDFGVIAQMCDEVVVMYAGRVAEQGPVNTIIDQPQHPYTKGLLSSIPSLADQPKTMLPTIEGYVPGLKSMPEGCRFVNRCSEAKERCSTSPPLTQVGDNHNVACHLVTPNQNNSQG